MSTKREAVDPDTPETMLERSELCHMMFFYLNRRSAGFLVLHYWAGFTFDEIAREAGISRNRVGQVLRTSERKLRHAYYSGRTKCERDYVEPKPAKPKRKSRRLSRWAAREAEDAHRRRDYEASLCACGCRQQRPMCAYQQCACGCGAYWPYCGVLDVAGIRPAVRATLRGATDPSIAPARAVARQ